MEFLVASSGRGAGPRKSKMRLLGIESGLEAWEVHLIAARTEPITSAEPLPPRPEIPRGSLVIVEGRAPLWHYGMALHLLHGSLAGAVAFCDLRLGAVVVASPSPLASPKTLSRLTPN